MIDFERQKITEELLQMKAVIIRPEKPFLWASGILSPIYCDNRKTLSFPKIRTFIRNAFVEMIRQEYGKPDVIAGVATGGIAQGVLVAQELGLPFVYVRPEPKKHGMENQVEGHLEPGQTVVVVEDLISTGGSSVRAIQALKNAGAQVKGLVAVFSYGFEEAKQNLENEKVSYHVLTDYPTLLQVAADREYIAESQIETLKKWAENPRNWKN